MARQERYGDVPEVLHHLHPSARPCALPQAPCFPQLRPGRWPGLAVAVIDAAAVDPAPALPIPRAGRSRGALVELENKKLRDDTARYEAELVQHGASSSGRRRGGRGQARAGRRPERSPVGPPSGGARPSRSATRAGCSAKRAPALQKRMENLDSAHSTDSSRPGTRAAEGPRVDALLLAPVGGFFSDGFGIAAPIRRNRGSSAKASTSWPPSQHAGQCAPRPTGS